METSIKGDKNENASLDAEELEYKIKVASQTLEHNIRFVSNCDAKASIILTAVGIVTSIIFAKYAFSEILSLINRCIELNNFLSKFCLLLFTSAICIMFLGVFNLISVLVATISEEPVDPKGKDSLTFFAGILKSGDYQTYREKFYEMSREDLLDDFIKQIYINADIAAHKYKKYNKGFKRTVTGVALFLLSLVMAMAIC